MYHQLNKSIIIRERYNNNLKNKMFFNILLKNNYFFIKLYTYNTYINYISIVRIRNRCTINGRARSICSKYRLSRFFFKDLASKGYLLGVKKK